MGFQIRRISRPANHIFMPEKVLGFIHLRERKIAEFLLIGISSPGQNIVKNNWIGAENFPRSLENYIRYTSMRRACSLRKPIFHFRVKKRDSGLDLRPNRSLISAFGYLIKIRAPNSKATKRAKNESELSNDSRVSIFCC